MLEKPMSAHAFIPKSTSRNLRRLDDVIRKAAGHYRSVRAPEATIIVLPARLTWAKFLFDAGGDVPENAVRTRSENFAETF